MKACKAPEDIKVNGLAQLKRSQHKAKGRRERADVGDEGMREGIRSFKARKSLSTNLNKIPLNFSSLLIAWTIGTRRAEQLRICGSLWGPDLQNGHFNLSETELENLVPVVQA